ncbi:hypothetical protein [Nostoc sp.]|uniref:hypothetical protein n=1 Tax=Nostoc sp. TaxID=1180 RepID=UPI002FF49000
MTVEEGINSLVDAIRSLLKSRNMMCQRTEKLASSQTIAILIFGNLLGTSLP